MSGKILSQTVNSSHVILYKYTNEIAKKEQQFVVSASVNTIQTIDNYLFCFAEAQVFICYLD